MAKFKVGDEVRIIDKEGYDFASVGNKGKIVDFREGSFYPYDVLTRRRGLKVVFSEKALELWEEHKEEKSDVVRLYDTGATRDTAEGKNDYEGFLHPICIRAFGDYMTKHRVQSDGGLRASDNWQKGIPKDDYMKSLIRHVLDLWLIHRGYDGRESIKDALCGILFNAFGYLFEVLKGEKK